jgi:hypothetical protein
MASALAEAHIEGQRRLRLLAAGAITGFWRDLGSWDEADVPRFLDLSVPTILAFQRTSVAFTEAYLAAFLERGPIGVEPTELIGAAVRAGTPPDVVYRRPFVQLWSALQEGKSFEMGLRAAASRIDGTAQADVQLASRATFNAVQEADDGIYGYERVADGGACAFCQEIDGAYVKSADASPLHDRCGCGLEPLTEPHPRAAFLPSGESTHDAFAIRQHGELGATLVAPDDHFTKL